MTPRSEEPVSGRASPEILAAPAVDRVVGVAAGPAIAFIVWGASSTDTLSGVATTALTGN